MKRCRKQPNIHNCQVWRLVWWIWDHMHIILCILINLVSVFFYSWKLETRLLAGTDLQQTGSDSVGQSLLDHWTGTWELKNTPPFCFQLVCRWWWFSFHPHILCSAVLKLVFQFVPVTFPSLRLMGFNSIRQLELHYRQPRTEI